MCADFEFDIEGWHNRHLSEIGIWFKDFVLCNPHKLGQFIGCFSEPLRHRQAGVSPDLLPLPIESKTVAETDWEKESHRGLKSRMDPSEHRHKVLRLAAGISAWTFLTITALKFMNAGREGPRARHGRPPLIGCEKM